MSAVPDLLGPYRVEGPLGQGGMGEVYGAWDERLQRHVAVKRLRGGVDRRRLLAEARATARLDHPAVVRVHDVLEHASGDWLVMEKVDGEPLSERLRARGPLPVDAARDLTRQLVDGLDCAHRSGVVHRDLKTENVLVDASGRAKIIDFGIALTAPLTPKSTAPDTRLTAENHVVGTARAMSPEQALGRPVDARSDLFSLGVLLYESLTGASPFAAEHPDDTVVNVCTHRPPAPRELRPEVPEDLSGLVLHLLEKDPACRPADSGEVRRLLDAGIRDSDEPADDEATLPRRRAEASGPGPDREPETTPASSPRLGLRISGAILALVLLVGLAALLAHLIGLSEDAASDEGAQASSALDVPRRVAVLPSLADGEGTATELVAAGLDSALEKALLDRPGLTLISSAVGQPLPVAPADAAVLLGADQLLQARARCTTVDCAVRLQRLRADGTVAELVEFSLPPLKAGLAYGLADAYVDRLFPGSRRAETDQAAVDAEDWQTYLQLHHEHESGAWGGREQELARTLAELRTRRPGWIEIYLFEAEVLTSPALADDETVGRIRDLLATASTVAPQDPRPRLQALRHALQNQDWDLAEDLLRSLERARPGDPDLSAHRASLSAGQGDMDEAVALQTEAAERRPTWVNLYRLARLQHRAGRIDACRRTLERLLQAAPDHLAGRWLEAQLELLHGSPGRAAELYGALVEQWPRAVGNQGVALLLAGDAAGAVDLFRQALELAPGHAPYRLNLADALWLTGDESRARELYGALVESQGGHGQLDESWQSFSLKAQALAHLGRSVEAASAIGRALALAPDEPQAAYEAALVYTVLDERASALAQARRALDGGVAPVWFRLPWFDVPWFEPARE